MNKKRILPISIFAILIICCLIFVFLLSPVKKDLAFENKASISFDQYIKSKSPDSLEYQPKQKQVVVSYSIPEGDLSSLLWSAFNSTAWAHTTSINIQGIYADIENSKVILYANTKIYSLIPSQGIFTFNSHIDKDTVIITLEQSQLGHIKLSNRYVMSKLKSIESNFLKVDIDKSEIVIQNNFRDFAKINSVDLSSDSVKVTALLPINSINDLIWLSNLDIFRNAKDSLRNYIP